MVNENEMQQPDNSGVNIMNGFALDEQNQDGFFTEKTNEYGIETSGSTGLVAGDMDNNGYPDIIKWRFLSEANPHHDCTEYDYETICTDDTNCYWEENNCWNGSELDMKPHLQQYHLLPVQRYLYKVRLSLHLEQHEDIQYLQP